MKAAVLTASVSRSGGGVSEVARNLALSLARETSTSITVLGLKDPTTHLDLADWQPLRPEIFPVSGPQSFGYAPALAAALDSGAADLAHVHGLWSYLSLLGHRWGRRHRRPFMITVHGMLSSHALGISTWKKKLAARLFENAAIRGATCIQAFTEQELASVRQFGSRAPVCVIPNGVTVPACSPVCPPPWNDLIRPGRKVLLYLGRLHPIKGLPNLLAAWQIFQRRSARARDWNLVIAGWGCPKHDSDLKVQVESARMQESVHFIGAQFGEAKAAAYHCADAFVLPSQSEGLPTAVLEAWANALPVLMTPECNLPEGFQTGAALRMELCPMIMASGLDQLAAMSDAELEAMGQIGRALVTNRFSWPQIASDMRRVYEWMLGGGAPPQCVSLAA